jgi:UDP-N-acetylglucosamine 3-dehydrogenase
MLKVAVIAVGTMGKQHARVYTEIPGVELVAVADPDENRIAEIVRRYKVKAYRDYREMLRCEKPDAVSVTAPTHLHYQVARDVVAEGIHLLVEKPLASTPEEALEIIRAADEKGVKLAVGHIERFNPAVKELKKRLDGGELGRVFLLHARRLGPFPERIQDMGVVIDLASHDLDVMHYLLGVEVERVYAETMRQIHTHYEDLLSGLLRFRNGIIGVLDVNRLTPTKIRELTVTGERGMFIVNYLTQELYFYENHYVSGEWEALGIFKGVGEGNMVRLRVEREEPLRAELRAFVEAIVKNELPPIGGRDGLRAVILAQKLVESGRTGEVVKVNDISEEGSRV